MKIVSIYFTKPEAELAKGLLESEGIVCVLKGDDAGGAWPNLSVGMGNYSLWVNEKDFEKAKEVLKPVDVQDSAEPVYRKKNLLFAGVVFLLVLIALMGGIFGRNWLRVPSLIKTPGLNHGNRQWSAVRMDSCREIEGRPWIKEVCYEYYFDGMVYSEANYFDHRPHGPFTIYYPDGSVRYVMNYAEGKLEGRGYEYFPSGRIRWEWNYKNDQLSGTVAEYYETGEMRATYPYVDDLLEGSAKLYYVSGQLADEGIYAKDRLLDTGKKYFSGVQKVLHENGHVWMESSYKDGFCEGPYVEYDENGKLLSRGVYKKNRPQNIKEFYPNGKLKSEIVYHKDMVRHMKEFDSQGRLLVEKNYSIPRD